MVFSFQLLSHTVALRQLWHDQLHAVSCRFVNLGAMLKELGLLSTVIALLGVAVLITYSPQNGVILLVMAFLISPMGLPLAAIWLMGKVQSLKFAIQELVYG